MSDRRSVNTRPGLSGQPCIGTSTAASVRPCASLPSASAGVSSSDRMSDDDLDRSTVHAPGGPGDVGGVLGAEEDDRSGNLVHLREPADRALRAGGLERLLAAAMARHLLRLVQEAALVHPELGLDWAGADRVD